MLLVHDTGSGAIVARLRRAIEASGGEVSLAYRTVDGRDEVAIDPDRSFHAASLVKVPVMIELFARAEAGSLALSDALPIRNRFTSAAGGAPYELNEADDSEKSLYGAVGETRTVEELCRAMIAVSSNLAANLLIDRLGVENIRGAVSRVGADVNGGVQVRRGVEDGKAFALGINNTVTARGVLVLFDKLARGEAVSPRADAAMIGLLRTQRFTDGIPAGLPPGIAVAHKTGNITRIHHDAGIVHAARPYALVILVRGIEDRAKSAALVAELSRIIYEAAGRLTP